MLTIIHEDDDGVEKFTLAQLAEMDPERFEQFAAPAPEPEDEGAAGAAGVPVNYLNTFPEIMVVGAPSFLSIY